ncbi:dihydrolipoyl dehydrogenase [candidate division KSB1 bacterium]|nr:dihydrolipoyl dehydrogenase [candidate division KSB1 bacterium]
MSDSNFDLVVLGTGPGGYVAAIRAAQLGMKVGVVEQNEIGGVCLNWGCIPTKALLRSAEMYRALSKSSDYGLVAENVSFDFSKIIKRSRRTAKRLSKGVEYLFKQNGISAFQGKGKLVSTSKITVTDNNGSTTDELTAKHIIIATGARPRPIPGVPFDGNRIISSKEAMALDQMPSSMIVIGAGAIGVEFAYFYSALGCNVTIVEMLPTILPIEDGEITDILTKSFKKTKVKVHTGTRVQNIDLSGAGVNVTIKTEDAEEPHKTLEADTALVAIGVQGNYEGIGLEEIGIQVEKGWIQVDPNLRTGVGNIYAIGDIIGPPWLAHVASAEGIHAAEQIAGVSTKPLDYDSIPACTYCHPQVASIGLTEKQAKEKFGDLRIGRFPFQANGKSLAMGESTGLVKLIYDARSNELVGAHIIHAEATELINELSVIKNSKINGHDFIKTIHAHPTLSEALMEAAAEAYDEAIHI